LRLLFGDRVVEPKTLKRGKSYIVHIASPLTI
jgi:hypothetical protein